MGVKSPFSIPPPSLTLTLPLLMNKPAVTNWASHHELSNYKMGQQNKIIWRAEYHKYPASRHFLLKKKICSTRSLSRFIFISTDKQQNKQGSITPGPATLSLTQPTQIQTTQTVTDIPLSRA